ncbi:transglycosylase domain-containing protein [Sinosporangium siamense]|nr:transglycosylase domain-containing protein [Sinosporangium siamense]
MAAQAGGPSGGRRGRRHESREIPPPDGPGGPGGPQGPDDGDGEGKPEQAGWKRFIPNWKIVVASVTVIIAGVFGMILVGYHSVTIPVVKQEEVDAQGSVIYYGDNKTVLARVGMRRKLVTIDQIPKHVQDAVVGAENRDFWTDSGIDFSGMVRSVWYTATGQQIQGASTITQQMARNYYAGLSQERSMMRKVREIFIAVKLNQQKSKQWILEQYLNNIFFGRNSYGIQAAAQAFFDKNVGQLTPQEAAYLAGRIQNPDTFDRMEAKGNMAATEERYRYAIGGLAAVDSAKYGDLPAKFPKSPKRIKHVVKQVNAGKKGYMVKAVLDELEARGVPEEEVQTGGYKIYTTFDKNLMDAAERAVKSQGNFGKYVTTSLAAVDPRNGRVIAFYGGSDYLKEQWNEAFMSQKQAASAFKPYVLAAWLDAGYSLTSWTPTVLEKNLPGTTEITNDHPMGTGGVDVIKATAQSVNTAFAAMGQKVTLEKVVDIAVEAGLDRKRLEKSLEEHKYLITIGSSPVTALEQAGGYSIFANAGKHYDTHVVTRAVDSSGTTVLKEKSTYNQVISPEAAADATVALQEVVKTGTGRNSALADRPTAGKTGTNNKNKEAWYVGFTPQLSTAVGMYKEVPKKLKNGKTIMVEAQLNGISGGSVPAAIWRTFMAEAMKGQEVMQFPPRANVGTPENIQPRPIVKRTPPPENNWGDGDGDNDWGDNGGWDNGNRGNGDVGCSPYDSDCGGGTDDLQLQGGGGMRGNLPAAPAATAAATAPSRRER